MSRKSPVIRVLLVEDNPADARLVRESLTEPGTVRFEITHVEELGEALQRLTDEEFDAVLLDLSLPDAHGLDAVVRVHDIAPDVPIVVLSGLQDEWMAILSVQRGAQDYLFKGERSGHMLSRAILYAVERKWSERYILHLAHHDALTNLPNRTLLRDRLTQALAQARRHKQLLAVLFLDLDHFKNINDTLGHAVGDLLLQGVAERLMKCMRATDTVARLGGDEFALVLPELARAEDVSHVAEKLLASLRTPFLVDGNELFVSASIGISLYPDDGEEPETLLKHSDMAMYRAKQRGRSNHQFFSQNMNAIACERMLLESGLRRALERSELRLVYQPEIDVATGKITGLEALLRWQHPDWGTLSPTRFIPMAEESGLILPIGEWVLNAVCEQRRAWRDAGLEVPPISINLSNRQLHQRDLPEAVARVLAENHMQPGDLELELTESGIVGNDDSTIHSLRQLSEMGCRITVDDFGTGYSSLSHLKYFPISSLKIDKSFIGDVAAAPERTGIVSAIIAFAHSLGLQAIAEGVETAEQATALREQGCDRMQGYYFSEPVAPEAVADLVREPREWLAPA